MSCLLVVQVLWADECFLESYSRQPRSYAPWGMVRDELDEVAL